MVRLVMGPLRWLCLLVPLAVVVGSVSAGFLLALDHVTRLRFGHSWLLWCLPVAGVLVVWVYQVWGKGAAAGNHLLLDEIHQPGAGVPRRMAVLVLFGTLVSHLCGASVGREGTAVQMGGGIAAAFARWFRPGPEGVRVLLMAGVAAGFGAVFGTPVAAAVFAVEVLVVGRIRHDALLACFFAAFLADRVCHAWGVVHTQYPVVTPLAEAGPVGWLWLKIVLAAVLFGWCARLFIVSTHAATGWVERRVSRPLLRPFLGGLVVIGLFLLVGSGDYLGLGVLGSHPDAVTLPACFDPAREIPASAWWWKLFFTVVALAAGFKGGEVTPLFFIGAALGNTLAVWMGVPVDWFAAFGMVALFAAATKTPLASTLLGVELFGAEHAAGLAAVCLIAWQCSGPAGIYRTQRRPGEGEKADIGGFDKSAGPP
jgi:H+/Cl- antiporter ClcA